MIEIISKTFDFIIDTFYYILGQDTHNTNFEFFSFEFIQIFLLCFSNN